MNQRLKDAVRLEKESLQMQKSATIAQHTNALSNVADFQIAATFADAAALELMTAIPAFHTVSGEVAPSENDLPDAQGGWAIRNTLASPDAASIQASIERMELLEQSEVLALGIDAAESANCSNSLEKMLCHQMALAHQTAFEVINRAMQQNNPVEMTRLLNAGARMMAIYQQAMLVMNRIKNGSQTITVQHVTVNGGQTLVTGKVQTGGKPPSPRGQR